MADYKLLVILVLMIINCTRCEIKHSIRKRVEELHNRSRELYGIRKDIVNSAVDIDRLLYPRGNKRKLSSISQLWNNYYACTARQLDSLTSMHLLPCSLIMVYQGAVARLPCTACVGPREVSLLTWMYTKDSHMSPSPKNFTQIDDQERMTKEQGFMSIYNVMLDDAGVYWCQVGDTEGGLIILEVVDAQESYTVVKPHTSRGPHPVDPEKYGGVILFSQWSAWSECSVCGEVGRRHRHGMCYVKLDPKMVKSYRKDPVKTANRSKLIELDDKLFELFEAFPDGLPCRSEYMPQNLRHLDAVKQRPSEIMIGMCKVRCDHKTSSTNGSNSAIMHRIDTVETLTYSLDQELPRQPPLPVRNTIFAAFGASIAIRCPGTTLRDVPVLWRVGTKILVPRDVDKTSGGRVHLNARDHLVFNTILYRDANLYSCWQRGNLAGTVKLLVWRGSHVGNHHVTLVGVIILAAVVLNILYRPVQAITHNVS